MSEIYKCAQQKKKIENRHFLDYNYLNVSISKIFIQKFLCTINGCIVYRER